MKRTEIETVLSSSFSVSNLYLSLSLFPNFIRATLLMEEDRALYRMLTLHAAD